MSVQSFLDLYSTKNNDELLQLAEQRDQLTMDAQTALSAELTSRQIDINEDPQNESSKLPTRFPPDSAAVRLRTGDFIEELLAFYVRHRSAYMKLIFPAVFCCTAVYIFRRQEVFEIQRQLPRGVLLLQHKIQLLEIGLLTWGSLVASWLVFSLSFGAICVATEQIQAGREAGIAESFAVTLKKPWPFLLLSLLLFVIFVICTGATLTVTLALAMKVSRFHLSALDSWLLGLASFGVGALAVSRLALSVPALILDDYGLRRALLRSAQLTRGKWSILTVLLFKSVAVGYIAAMLPFWLSRFIPAGVQLPHSFGWFLLAVSVALVTTVEPLMFIGFALIYLKTCPAPKAVEAQPVSA